jgi:hypothetical protein
MSLTSSTTFHFHLLFSILSLSQSRLILATWNSSQRLLKERKTKKSCIQMVGRTTFPQQFIITNIMRRDSGSCLAEIASTTAMIHIRLNPFNTEFHLHSI